MQEQNGRVSTIKAGLEGYEAELVNSKASGKIKHYLSESIPDTKGILGFAVQMFIKGSTVHFRMHEIGLSCLLLSIFVTGSSHLFKGRESHHATIDYCEATAALPSLLTQKDKHNHTYTHTFTPLITKYGSCIQLVATSKLSLSQSILR
jgi:hypothetical protein